MPRRSNAFYQRVFGLNVQARQGPTAPLLGVGDKIQFLMFGGGGARGGRPRPRPASINHICLNLTGFDRDGILKTLEGYGIKPRGDATRHPAARLVRHQSHAQSRRGAGRHAGAVLTDPDGLPIQIQDARYCGGGGYLGDVCAG